MAGFKECVDKAAANGIAVSGSISMAFGSPWDKEIPIQDVKDIVNAYLNVGVTEISLSDASGMAYPSQVYNMCTEMMREFPQVEWWLHFHNTRGLGVANIVAGMEAGVRNFDTSFAGVGGCPFVPGAGGKCVHRGRGTYVRRDGRKDRHRSGQGHGDQPESGGAGGPSHGQLPAAGGKEQGFNPRTSQRAA